MIIRSMLAPSQCWIALVVIIFTQLFGISAANCQHTQQELEQVGELMQNPEPRAQPSLVNFHYLG